MAKTLTQNVKVDGKWYGPAYGNADVPDGVAAKIKNPAAFAPIAPGFDLGVRGSDTVQVEEGKRAELQAMELADLRSYAEAKGVDIPKGASKKQIIDAVLAVE